ncbi:MAG: DUF6261 family protein, partial [Alistipes sp.]|nr:DUF6261 family protein [Alistipes sp.]
SRLHNGEHFQFMTTFRDLVKAATPAKLKIEAPFAAFLAVYADLDEALKKIMKSEHTKRIAELDAARDSVFRGMTDTANGAAHHFNPAVREAAGRVGIAMKTYGNVAAMNYDDETAMIANLLKDLTVKYLADVEMLDLGAWIGELDRLSEEFKRLMLERYDEGTGRSTLVLREVRGRMDDAYRAVARRVDALQEVSGDEPGAPWAAFIAELNEVIARADNLLAQREGRAAAERAREQAEAAAAAGVDVETWRAMQRAAAAAEKAAKLVAAASATAAVVEKADAEAVEVVGAKK